MAPRAAATAFAALGLLASAPPALAGQESTAGASANGLLRFMHIPKTGGTTIEDLGRSYLKGHPQEEDRVKWGRGYVKHHCTSLHNDKGWHRCGFKNPRGKTDKCSPWHTPPSSDDKIAGYYNNDEYKTFCVVRDPAQRLISEWKYRQNVKQKKGGAVSDLCGPGANASLAKWANGVLDSHAKHPNQLDCHIRPQVDFVWDRSGTQVCHHVLRFEKLAAEFEALMHEYGLPLSLAKHSMPGGGSPEKHCELRLPEEVEKKIYEIYRKDYDAFGYAPPAGSPRATTGRSSHSLRGAAPRKLAATPPSAPQSICLRGRLVPSLYILGAQKSGTTTLFALLSNAKSVFDSGKKELHFFDQHSKHWRLNDRGRVEKEPKLMRGVPGGKLESWWDRWPECRRHTEQIAFDATPAYLAVPRVPQRMASWYGSVLSKRLQFVVLLREPLSRMQSSFYYRGSEHWPSWRDQEAFVLPRNDSKAFKAYTEHLRNGTWGCAANVRGSDISRRCMYFQKSAYAVQLASYFEQFDSRQFLVVPFRHIQGDRSRQTTARVLQRAGLSEELGRPQARDMHKNSGKHSHGSLEEDLGSAGVEDMRRLFDETGNGPWAVARVLAGSNAELDGYAGKPGDVDAVGKWLLEGW